MKNDELNKLFKIISVSMLIVTVLFNIKYLLKNSVQFIAIFKLLSSVFRKLTNSEMDDRAKRYEDELKYNPPDRYGSLDSKPNQIEMLNRAGV